MQPGGGGLGAQHVSGPNLHASCAQRHGDSDAFRVRDAAGGDDRYFHRLHDLRDQRERADLGVEILRQEDAAMATRSLRIASSPSMAQGSEPGPPALDTATVRSLPCTPAIGA